MKKKGFTLIELLAVIAILAILLVVAIPNVIRLYKNAKKKGFVTEAQSIISTAQKQYMSDQVSGGTPVKTRCYDGTNSSYNKLELSGNDTTKYYVKYSNDKVVRLIVSTPEYSIDEMNSEGVDVSDLSSSDNLKSKNETDYTTFTCNQSKEVDVSEVSAINDDGINITKHVSGNSTPVPETYTITYNANGGSGAPEAQTKTPDVALTLSTTIPTKANNWFIGWAETSDATVPTYWAGSVYNTNSNKTLYAVWTSEATSTACFDYSSYHNEITITDYYDYENDDSSNDACPKNVVIPDTISDSPVVSVGSSAFESKQITSVIIPSSVTSIDDFAFYNNRLTNVVLPSVLEYISFSTFAENRLTSLVLPNSLISIDDNAFAHNQLSSISIPSSVAVINSGVFNDNKLPDSQAFLYQRNGDGSEDTTTLIGYGGAKRSNVVIPSSVTSILASALLGSKIESVTIPSSVTNIESGAFNDNLLLDSQAFIYARNNDGTEDTTTIVSYGGAKKSNVTIPAGVTTIDEASFEYAKITSVTIPEGVTTINAHAFQNNQLTSVTIPSSVNVLGVMAFADNALTSVCIRTKSNSSGFSTYNNPFSYAWADGYSNSNIIWQCPN